MVVTNLSKLLAEKKVSQRELADRINVSHVTISSIINRKQSIKVDTLQRIAEVLQVSVSFFFNEEDLILENLNHKKPSINKYSSLILIVSYDYKLRKFIKSCLFDRYSISCSNNYRDGFNKILALNPDVIITDDKPLYEKKASFCYLVKTKKKFRNFPIVQISGSLVKEHQNDISGLPADSHLRKPLKKTFLRKNIKKLVDSRKVVKEIIDDDFEFFSISGSLNSSDMRYLKKTIHLIKERISDFDLNVDELSKEIGMSRVHFHRKFKNLTGKSPNEFIKNIRLKRSIYLLSDKDSTVSEIAFRIGFSSPSYFSNCFKKHYGISPSRFKSNYKKRDLIEDPLN